jgi:hypothetical protein
MSTIVHKVFIGMHNGRQSADLELIIDTNALARRLWLRAMRNDKRKATSGHGAIVAKVSNIKDMPQ